MSTIYALQLDETARKAKEGRERMQIDQIRSGIQRIAINSEKWIEMQTLDSLPFQTHRLSERRVGI